MSEEAPVPAGFVGRFRAAVAALVLVVAAAGGYAVHERNVVKDLAAQNSAINSTLQSTHDQMAALSTKLDAMNAEKAAEKASPSQAGVYRKGVTPASTRRRIEDPRWKKMQGQLDEQGKQIDATRQDLVSARTELQGSIAMTHDELVLLEKKGERNYYEFDLDKTSQFQRQGPVGIRLRKANTKHAYADLELLVDDFKVSKKHVNIYEPVVSYAGDRKMPVELVINSISKNHIHGYVSAPKYKAAELEAMASSTANSPATAPGDAQSPAPGNAQSSAPAKPSPIRQKLPSPDAN